MTHKKKHKKGLTEYYRRKMTKEDAINKLYEDGDLVEVPEHQEFIKNGIDVKNNTTESIHILVLKIDSNKEQVEILK